MLETPIPLHLEYRLTEADVRHYCSAGRARKFWRSCRCRKGALLLLAMIGAFLIGTIFHAYGVRSGSLALGTTFLILRVLAWVREAWREHRFLQLAREMGLPRDIRLVFSSDGIAEEADREILGPVRNFSWPEVVAVTRIEHLMVFRLRPAGVVLIVPDGAFPSPKDRSHFEETLLAWRVPVAHRNGPSIKD